MSSRPTFPGPAVTVEPTLASVIGRHPAAIRHGLAHEARLAPERLAAIMDDLPPSWIKRRAEPAGLGSGSPDEIRLVHMELVPSLGSVVDRCLTEAGAAEAGVAEGGMTARSAVILMAPPLTVTDLHLDHHHNLLMQVRGTKDITIAWFADPLEQLARVAEAFADQSSCSGQPTERLVFHLGPGDGVYIPPYVFHGVQVHDTGDSLAMACAFSTVTTERQMRAHRVNLALARRGFHPPPVGTAPRRERAKAWMAGPIEDMLPSPIMPADRSRTKTAR